VRPELVLQALAELGRQLVPEATAHCGFEQVGDGSSLHGRELGRDAG
jgi:hypothetical protein